MCIRVVRSRCVAARTGEPARCRAGLRAHHGRSSQDAAVQDARASRADAGLTYPQWCVAYSRHLKKVDGKNNETPARACPPTTRHAVAKRRVGCSNSGARRMRQQCAVVYVRRALDHAGAMRERRCVEQLHGQCARCLRRRIRRIAAVSRRGGAQSSLCMQEKERLLKMQLQIRI